MDVHVSVDGFVNVDAVPTEARRGHQVPWSRSWRPWRAGNKVLSSPKPVL